MGKSIIAAVIFLLLVQKAAAEIIWSDGFEDGKFSAWLSVDGNWATSGGSVHSGLKRAEIMGPTSPGEDTLLAIMPCAGHSNLRLSYWYRIYDGLESPDFLFVEWAYNGPVNWQQLAVYNSIRVGGDWQEASFALPNVASLTFYLRLRATFSTVSDCMYFDDFTLSEDPPAIPEPATLVLLAFGLPLFLALRRYLF